MAISMDAIEVLVTVMPIGLLIVGVEVRGLPTLLATERAGTWALWVLGALFMAALLVGLEAERLMVVSLLNGTPLSAYGDVMVRAGFWLVGVAAFLLLVGSLAFKLGIPARLARRAYKRVSSSPRRFARRARYIDEHHPDWRSIDE